MYRGPKGKLVFDNGYERAAYATLEAAAGRLQTEIAKEIGVAPQRVSQLVKWGHQISGTKPSDPVWLIAAKFRRHTHPSSLRDGTPENFFYLEARVAALP